MEYKIVIDQEKAKRYGLNKNEAALVCFCLRLPFWADQIKIKGRTYYFIARSKVVEELPYFYEKKDTVRRAFNSLKRKKLSHYEQKKGLDYVCPTRKVEGWNTLGKTFAGEKRFAPGEKTFGKADEALSPVNTGFFGKQTKKLPTDQYIIKKKSDQYAHARIDRSFY